MLQRIYGTAFPTKEALDEHLKLHRGGQGSATTASSARSSTSSCSTRSRRRCRSSCRRARSSTTASSTTCATLYARYGYEEVVTPQVFDPKLFRTSGHLGQLQREHVPARGPRTSLEKTPTPRRKARRRRSQAATRFALKPMNCPSHCLIFGSAPPQLPRAPVARRRLRAPPPLRARRRRARPRARAHASARTTRTSSAPRSRSHGEIERFIELLLRGLQGVRLRRRSTSSSRRGPRSASARDEIGTAPRARSPTASSGAGCRSRSRRARARSTGRRSSSTSRTRSSARWQLGTIQYDPNLPERFELDVHRRGRQGAPPGDAPPRDPRLARALLRRLPRALRRATSRPGSRRSRPSCSR